MTENNLLVNEGKARDFLQMMLPKLVDDEVFIMAVFSRKKYNKKASGGLYSRDLVTENDIDWILRKLKRMCYLPEDYQNYKTSEVIPPEAFVCYIDLSPKSVLKAYRMFVDLENRRIYEGIKNGSQFTLLRRMKNDLMSSIHRSNSYKPYILLDLDTRDFKIANYVFQIVKYNCPWISKTRGGYHFIVNNEPKIAGSIYMDQRIRNIAMSGQLEIKSDVMTPIPGILQGGFEVTRTRSVFPFGKLIIEEEKHE